jgi:chemotaxis protein CheD
MHVHDRRNVGELRALPGQSVHLLAGQLYFGHKAAQVRTLLGSCVAVTLWHPQRRLGGMCHFLLPNRRRAAGTPRDGRYGDEALEMLVQAIEHSGTHPHDYEVHLYGGADTMPDQAGIKFNIGERNIEQGWALIDHYGFQLQAIDVGDHIPRTVVLDLSDGHVEMRRGQAHHQRKS